MSPEKPENIILDAQSVETLSQALFDLARNAKIPEFTSENDALKPLLLFALGNTLKEKESGIGISTFAFEFHLAEKIVSEKLYKNAEEDRKKGKRPIIIDTRNDETSKRFFDSNLLPLFREIAEAQRQRESQK